MKTIVCGIPFEIKEGSKDLEPFGRTSGRPALIEISPECSTEQKEATLVHEWIHAVFMCNGIAHEEVQVGVLATELFRSGFRVKCQE